MSTLWTPGGERPVPPRPAAPSAGAPPGDPPGPPPDGGSRPPGRGRGADARADEEPDEAELEELAELQAELIRAPAEVVVANHAFGLFQLAALHLSQPHPDFESARLAIDAMGALVVGMVGRLGQVEAELNEGVAQIRLAFVQVQAAHAKPPGPEPSPSSPPA